MKDKLCPIFSIINKNGSYCLEKDCTWWDGYGGGCVIHNLTYLGEAVY